MMRSGVIAQKVGMTRVFTAAGEHVPVTVLRLANCQVVAHRTKDKNGYVALQLGAGMRKPRNLTKADRGHFAVAKVEPNTPAARAGLRGGTRTAEYNGLDISLGGDLIVRIGNRPVASAQDVSRAVTRLAAGQRVAVVVLRGGTTRRVVQVTLAERPA